jgi:hypothetical protein
VPDLQWIAGQMPNGVFPLCYVVFSSKIKMKRPTDNGENHLKGAIGDITFVGIDTIYNNPFFNTPKRLKSFPMKHVENHSTYKERDIMLIRFLIKRDNIERFLIFFEYQVCVWLMAWVFSLKTADIIYFMLIGFILAPVLHGVAKHDRACQKD